MTDEQLQTLARECGAQVTDYINYAYGCEVVLFDTPEALQAFVLRIEAQAIKSKQQVKQPHTEPHTDSAMNCELVFANGKLIAVKT